MSHGFHWDSQRFMTRVCAKKDVVHRMSFPVIRCIDSLEIVYDVVGELCVPDGAMTVSGHRLVVVHSAVVPGFRTTMVADDLDAKHAASVVCETLRNQILPFFEQNRSLEEVLSHQESLIPSDQLTLAFLNKSLGNTETMRSHIIRAKQEAAGNRYGEELLKRQLNYFSLE